MIQESDETNIRKYLLGELAEEEQTRVEERLMTEDQYFNLLEAVEDELIDDRVSNELTREEQERFDAYFLSTPERREKLKFAEALREYASKETAKESSEAKVIRPPRWSSPFSNPYLIGAAAATIIIGIGLAAYLIIPIITHPSEASRGLAALNKAFNQQRPTQARITGFDYAPSPPNVRGSEQGRVDTTSLSRAERILLDEVAERPGAQSYHALGRLYLAEHKLDEAIEQFEKALKEDPNNAQLHNDYGVALFEKGKVRQANQSQGKNVEELSKSIEHFNRALELDANFLEALFNRALLHQYMTLRRQSEQDWRAYLEKDPDSKWAAEAREYLRQLEQSKNSDLRSKEELLKDFLTAYSNGQYERIWDIASRNREAISGKLIWWQLLDAYFNPVAKEETLKAEDYLSALTYLGQKEFEMTGDRYVSGLAAFYKRLSRENLEDAARAHGLVNRGHTLCIKAEYANALDSYNDARNYFQKAGDHYGTCFADYWIGYCHQRMGKTERGQAVLETLRQECEDNAFLWLLAQTTNTLANIMIDTHNFSRAVEYSKEALKISESISDAYDTQKNLAQLANQYKYIDDYQQSLNYMHHCLESARAVWSGPRQMWRSYDTLAEVLSAIGLYGAAADFEKEALQLALEEIRDPAFTFVSYTHLGLIYEKQRNHAEAIKFAQLGYESVEHLSNERGGLSMMAYSSVQLGHIYRQASDFDNALTCYDRAIGFLSNLNNVIIYDAHKGRLLCYIARGNDNSAKDELQVVLKFSENYRSNIFEEKNRNKFFDVEQSFYDAAVDFQYSHLRDQQAAFELSETSRARSLLDLMRMGAQVSGSQDERELIIRYVSQPLKLADIQKQLPKNVHILEYAMLDDKLLIWNITKDRFSAEKKDIGQNDLKEKVLNYCEMVSSQSGRAEEILRESKELYSLLILPVAPLLRGAKQICIIPDKTLNYLPFNTLFSPDDGRYLISDYVLSFSPSANIYLLCADYARKKGSVRSESILSVGNPRADREAFPTLDDLPSAAREARKITEFYDLNRFFAGDNAKESAVKAEMRKADVIHLASHYIIDERSPMLSKLLLAKGALENETGNEADGMLQADEIYKERPLHARLIVLSACQTGVERYYNAEGMIGMSRTFIAAGVPLVVASLWPVDSDSTAELMIKFHRYRKLDKRPTIEALRLAQLDMIGSQDAGYNQPNHWAPFIAVGGSADF